MVVASPFLEGCFPGRTAEGLAPTQELGLCSPLTWECDKILGTHPHRTPDCSPYRIGDYVPHI